MPSEVTVKGCGPGHPNYTQVTPACFPGQRPLTQDPFPAPPPTRKHRAPGGREGGGTGTRLGTPEPVLVAKQGGPRSSVRPALSRVQQRSRCAPHHIYGNRLGWRVAQARRRPGALAGRQGRGPAASPPAPAPAPCPPKLHPEGRREAVRIKAGGRPLSPRPVPPPLTQPRVWGHSDCGDPGQAALGEWGAGPCGSGRGVLTGSSERSPHSSSFWGQAGLGALPACDAPRGQGRGPAQPAPPRPDLNPCPAHRALPRPASDLELIASVSPAARQQVPGLGPSRGSPSSAVRSAAPHRPGQPRRPFPRGSWPRFRAAPTEGAPALLTHRSPERRGRAQLGTPRHVPARAGASREAGPARGTGAGEFEVASAREGLSAWATSPGAGARPPPALYTAPWGGGPGPARPDPARPPFAPDHEARGPHSLPLVAASRTEAPGRPRDFLFPLGRAREQWGACRQSGVPAPGRDDPLLPAPALMNGPGAGVAGAARSGARPAPAALSLVAGAPVGGARAGPPATWGSARAALIGHGARPAARRLVCARPAESSKRRRRRRRRLLLREGTRASAARAETAPSAAGRGATPSALGPPSRPPPGKCPCEPTRPGGPLGLRGLGWPASASRGKPASECPE
ncbi:basic proline-rich protein-like [Elephas maximus indicus]|uniref:basic proline-rich protein-like n=1 Tax=Elephas maximus indicus TaxID=99487 RepID=UPI002116C485|nr:basic proline-rich protein-like [Elephas maximus indicus]